LNSQAFSRPISVKTTAYKLVNKNSKYTIKLNFNKNEFIVENMKNPIYLHHYKTNIKNLNTKLLLLIKNYNINAIK